MFLSVIIPVREEAENILSLAKELGTALEPQYELWECIWVDDGSQDDTLSVLRQLAHENPKHRYLSFLENSGQSAAFWAGFQAARGTILATIDGDGQNDPSDIPRLMDTLITKKLHMVNGYRIRRQDSLIRKISSRIANTLRNLFTGRTVRDVGCTTRVFHRECIEGLPGFKGMHRFLPTFVAMKDLHMEQVPVNHRPRLHGKTKYSINNRLWVGIFDMFGVFWFKKRAFNYRIKEKSY